MGTVRQNRKHLLQKCESKFPLGEKMYCRHGLVLAFAYQENVLQMWASAGTYLLWKSITEHTCHSVKLLFYTTIVTWWSESAVETTSTVIADYSWYVGAVDF